MLDEIQKKAEEWLGYPIESFNYKLDYTEPAIPESKEDPLIDQVNYNGISLDIWEDTLVYYTIVAGKRVNICKKSEDYMERIRLVIDTNMNLIHDFGGGAKLVYFQNGKHRDIKLIDGNRTLKVFLTTGTGNVDEAKIITSAKTSLNKYRKAELK